MKENEYLCCATIVLLDLLISILGVIDSTAYSGSDLSSTSKLCLLLTTSLSEISSNETCFGCLFAFANFAVLSL